MYTNLRNIDKHIHSKWIIRDVQQICYKTENTRGKNISNIFAIALKNILKSLILVL